MHTESRLTVGFVLKSTTSDQSQLLSTALNVSSQFQLEGNQLALHRCLHYAYPVCCLLALEEQLFLRAKGFRLQLRLLYHDV